MKKARNQTARLEYCLKNDDLGDPMINDYQIIAIGAATKESWTIIKCRPN
ncbi:MAG: phosphoribosylaminoimidazolesuccinocarboxamide synthase [Eubacteriales bacterium]